MSRPRKWRKVCCMPSVNRFGPLSGCRNEGEVIQMTVDEYETIRLIDLEGMNQEAFVKYMEEMLPEINKELPNYAKLKRIKVMLEDFERTPKKSIKRYIYQR